MATNTLKVADLGYKKIKKVDLKFNKITKLFLNDIIDADEFDRRKEQIMANTRANNNVRSRINQQSSRDKSKRLSQRKNRQKVFDEPSDYFIDLCKKKMYTESNPFDIFTLYEVLPAFSSFKQFLSKSCKKYVKDICRILVSFLNFGYQLWRSRNITDLMSAVTSFTLGLPDLMVNYFTDMIKEYWDMFYECFCTQPQSDIEMTEMKVTVESFTLSDKAQWLKEFLTRVLNTEVYNVLRHAVLGILSMHWFNKDFAKSCYNYLGKPDKNKSFIELLNDILSGIIVLFKCSEALISGSNVNEVLLADDPCMALMDKARTTFFYQDKLYDGNEVLGQRDIRKYYAELLEIIVTSTHLLLTIPTIEPKYRSIKEVKLKAEECVSLVLNRMASAKRAPPIAIVLGKNPGIGKSRLAEMYYRAHCIATGREFREGMVFTRCQASEYFDGCNPMSQHLWCYGEVGNIHTDIVSRMGDPIVSEIQSLIDGTPFPMNMAFKEKGMYNAIPEFLLIHTNNMTMNFDKIMYDPRAMYRRFLFIEAEVLPDFTDDSKIILDVEKSVAAGGNMLDRYNFVTYTYKITEKGVFKHVISEGCGDVYKHSAFIEKYMRKHVELQDKVLKQVDNSYDFLYKKGKPEPDFELELKSQTDEYYVNLAQEGQEYDFQKYVSPKQQYDYMHAHKGHGCDHDSLSTSEEDKEDYPLICVESKDFDVVISDVNQDEKSWFSDVKYNEFEEEPLFVCKKMKKYDKFIIHDVTNDVLSLMGIFEVPLLIGNLPKDISFIVIDKIDVFLSSRDDVYNITYHAGNYTGFTECSVESVSGFMNRPFVSTERGPSHNQVVSERQAINFVQQLKYDERIEVCPIKFSTKFLFYLDEIMGGINAYVRIPILSTFYIISYLFGSMFYFSGYSLRRIADGLNYYWPDNFVSMMIKEYYVKVISIIVTFFLVTVNELIVSYLEVGKKLCKKFNRTTKAIIRGDVLYLRANPKWALLSSGVLVIASLLSVFLAHKIRVSLKSRRKVVVESLRENIKESQQRQFNASEGIQRFAPRHGTTWTQTIDNEFLAPHKGTLKDLSDKIAVHTHYCIVRTEVSERITRVAPIDGTIFICNEHAFNGCDHAIISIPVQGVIANNVTYEDILIESKDMYKLGNDLVLVDLHSIKRQAGNMLKHFIALPKFQSTKGHFMHQEVNLIYEEGSFDLLSNDDFKVETTVTGYFSYYATHAVGDCGTLVVAVVDGKSVGIVGVHSGGSRDDKFCIASAISRDVIQKGMEALRNQRVSRIFVNSATQIPLDLCYLPHHKSVWAWQQFDHVTYVGTIIGEYPTLNKRSELMRMPYANKLSGLFERHFDFKRTADDIYGRPVMLPYTRDDGTWMSPYTNIMDKTNKPIVSLSGDILDIVVSDLLEHITTQFREKGIVRIDPLNQDCAINGVVGDYYTKRINVATSAGFGFSGGKKKFLPFVDDDEINREPTEELQEAIDELISCYLKGESGNCPITCQLKDEPISMAKVLKAKTRGFYMVNLPFLIVARMFLSPFYTLMVQYSELFYTAVGINMHVDSHDMITQMMEFAMNMMEGDYGGFDVSNPVDIARAAATVVYEVLKEFGYNEDALLIVKGLLSDGVYPLIHMLGDLFIKAGMQPSGKYATAEDNSLKALIMLMYFWYSQPELVMKKFRDFCKPIVYGDDTGVSVKDEVKEVYNNQTYQVFCKDVLGMEYTSADKKEDIEKFVSYEDFSFLKRKFVQNSEGIYEGRLALASLYKTLEWVIPSKAVTLYEQVGSMLSSVAREVFFYLEEKAYILFINDLLDLVAEGLEFDRSFFAKKIPSYNTVFVGLYGEMPLGSD